jgi:hypothetical protein
MTKQINFFYSQYATQFMQIDGQGAELVCTIPSESNGFSYEVQCTEHEDHVEVVKCNCQGHRRWGHCKHADICQSFWNRIYRVNIEKSRQASIEAAMDASDEQEEIYAMAEIADQIVAVAPKVEAPVTFRKKGNKLVKVAIKTRKPSKIAKIIEQAVSATVPTPKRDMMTAQFGNQGFRLMR